MPLFASVMMIKVIGERFKVRPHKKKGEKLLWIQEQSSLLGEKPSAIFSCLQKGKVFFCYCFKSCSPKAFLGLSLAAFSMLPFILNTSLLAFCMTPHTSGKPLLLWLRLQTVNGVL